MLTIDATKKDEYFPCKRYVGDLAGKNIYFSDFKVTDAIIATRTEKNMDFLIFRTFTEEVLGVINRDESKIKSEMERLGTTKALVFVVTLEKKKYIDIFFDIDNEKIIREWFFQTPMYKLFDTGDTIAALFEDNIVKPSPLKTCGVFFSKENCMPVLGAFYYFTQWLLPPATDLIARDYGAKTALHLYSAGLPVKVEINAYSNYNLNTDPKALFDLPGELIEDYVGAISKLDKTPNRSIIIKTDTASEEETKTEEIKTVEEDIKQLFFPELTGKETVPLSYFAKCRNKKAFIEAVIKLHPKGIVMEIDLPEFKSYFVSCELKPTGYLIFKALTESPVFEKNKDGQWATNDYRTLIKDILDYELIAISRHIPSRSLLPRTKE